MFVVVAVLFFFRRFHAAVEAVYFATGFPVVATLKLNGGVTDMVLFIEHSGKGLQDGRTATWGKVIDEHVTGEGIHAAGDTPDMQVVYVLHALNMLHIFDKVGKRDISGNGLQENISGLAQNTPCSYGDQHGYSDGEQWINHCPTRQEDDDASYNNADGGYHIAKDMKGRGPYIKAVTFFL